MLRLPYFLDYSISKNFCQGFCGFVWFFCGGAVFVRALDLKNNNPPKTGHKLNMVEQREYKPLTKW
ncbi:MAG: hypothetical protein COY82_01075 [Parcubacteria group bacterium CG_4_10_14_0_8_um_filter_35_7]|nr:MAG: hypothetical protein COY82_01075 [Parcubacteria group bacterium CG_4_10_14_0_8_um_filter_35_7]